VGLVQTKFWWKKVEDKYYVKTWWEYNGP